MAQEVSRPSPVAGMQRKPRSASPAERGLPSKGKTPMINIRPHRAGTWRLRARLTAAAAALAAFAAVPGVQAADIQFAGVLPNGAMFTKSVESMTEGRFRHLVRQHTDYSCGAAAL